LALKGQEPEFFGYNLNTIDSLIYSACQTVQRQTREVFDSRSSQLIDHNLFEFIEFCNLWYYSTQLGKMQRNKVFIHPKVKNDQGTVGGPTILTYMICIAAICYCPK